MRAFPTGSLLNTYCSSMTRGKLMELFRLQTVRPLKSHGEYYLVEASQALESLVAVSRVLEPEVALCHHFNRL